MSDGPPDCKVGPSVKAPKKWTHVGAAGGLAWSRIIFLSSVDFYFFFFLVPRDGLPLPPPPPVRQTDLRFYPHCCGGGEFAGSRRIIRSNNNSWDSRAKKCKYTLF